MTFPLDLLIEEKGNIYEMTCATCKRALQLCLTGEIEENDPEGKIVTRAIRQILTKKVEFQLER